MHISYLCFPTMKKQPCIGIENKLPCRQYFLHLILIHIPKNKEFWCIKALPRVRRPWGSSSLKACTLTWWFKQTNFIHTSTCKIILNEYDDEFTSMYLPQRTSVENFCRMLDLAFTKPMHILKTYTAKTVEIYRIYINWWS